MQRFGAFGLLLLIWGCPEADDDLTVPLTLTPRTLKDGRVGLPYMERLEAEGGRPPLTWVVSTGSLPPGLEAAGVDDRGVSISGQPTQAGTFAFDLTVMDADGRISSASLSITIAGGLSIEPDQLPDANLGAPYSATVSAVGAEGTLTWSIASGELPPGINFGGGSDPTLTLEGTPTTPGSFFFAVAVADDAAMAVRSYTVEVIADGLVVIANPLPNGVVGTPYQAQLSAAGGAPPYVWSTASTVDGLTLDGSGALTGTPTMAGTFSLEVRVTDDAGATADETFTLQIDPVVSLPAIVPGPLPPGQEGIAYDQTIQAMGGQGAYVWTVSGGALPPGLTLVSSSTAARIAGTPTMVGTFNFEVTVEDATAQTDTAQLTLEILPAPLPLLITTATVPPTAEAGLSYVGAVGAQQGTPPYLWGVTQGALPPGVDLDVMGTPSTMLSGIPSLPGTYSFTVSVFDQNNDRDDQAFTVTVDPPSIPLTITTSTLADADECQPYQATIAADAGSRTDYVWSIVAGALPPGLTLSADGTPEATLSGFLENGSTGTHVFTVRVVDSAGGMAERALTILVTDDNLGGAVTLAGSYDGVGGGYVVRACGSLSAPVSLVPPGADSADPVQITDDGQSVLLFARTGTDITLWLADISSEPFSYVGPLNGTAVSGVSVPSLAPDASGLVYSRRDGAGAELFYVSLATGVPSAPVRINGNLPTGGTVLAGWPIWSPDGSKIVYVADQNIMDRDELWYVDLAGGVPTAPVRVNAPVTYALAPDVQWMHDSSGVIYSDSENQSSGLGGNLWFVGLSAGVAAAPVRIDDGAEHVERNDTPGSIVDYRPQSWAISPDGDRLFYRAGANRTIRLVDLTTMPPPPPVLVSNLTVQLAEFSPTSDRLLLRVDDGFNLFQMWVAEVFPTPLPPIRVDNAAVGQTTTFWAWSPDGDRLAYSSFDIPAGIDIGVHVADLAGTVTRAAIPSSAWPTAVAFDPTSTRLAYTTLEPASGNVNTYVADLTPGAVSAQLLAPVAATELHFDATGAQLFTVAGGAGAVATSAYRAQIENWPPPPWDLMHPALTGAGSIEGLLVGF